MPGGINHDPPMDKSGEVNDFRCIYIVHSVGIVSWPEHLVKIFEAPNHTPWAIRFQFCNCTAVCIRPYDYLTWNVFSINVDSKANTERFSVTLFVLSSAKDDENSGYATPEGQLCKIILSSEMPVSMDPLLAGFKLRISC